eukprot:CFRG3191T1
MVVNHHTGLPRLLRDKMAGAANDAVDGQINLRMSWSTLTNSLLNLFSPGVSPANLFSSGISPVPFFSDDSSLVNVFMTKSRLAHVTTLARSLLNTILGFPIPGYVALELCRVHLYPHHSVVRDRPAWPFSLVQK